MYILEFICRNWSQLSLNEAKEKLNFYQLPVYIYMLIGFWYLAIFFFSTQNSLMHISRPCESRTLCSVWSRDVASQPIYLVRTDPVVDEFSCFTIQVKDIHLEWPRASINKILCGAYWRSRTNVENCHYFAKRISLATCVLYEWGLHLLWSPRFENNFKNVIPWMRERTFVGYMGKCGIPGRRWRFEEAADRNELAVEDEVTVTGKIRYGGSLTLYQWMENTRRNNRGFTWLPTSELYKDGNGRERRCATEIIHQKNFSQIFFQAHRYFIY